MYSFVESSSAARGWIFLLILLTSTTGPVTAQDETAYYFLRLPPSAHAAAIGSGATAPGSEDIHQFMYNPAVLSDTQDRRISLSYLNHLSDINAGGLAYGHSISGIGTIGAGLQFLGYGSIDQTDASGQTTGSFSASDAAVSVGLGRDYSENLRVGATGHMIFSSVAESQARALALDVGLLYHYPPFDLTIGASVNNIGAEVSALEASTRELPRDFRLSITKQMEYVPLLLAITGYSLNTLPESIQSSSGTGIVEHLRFGGTLQLTSAFELRFGYNPRRHRAMKLKSRLDLAGVSAGFGISLFRVTFDYAYESWSSFGGLHYLTVGTKL